MAEYSNANRLGTMEPKYTYAFFLDARPLRDALDHAVGVNGEEMGARQAGDLHSLPGRMGRSRLRIPATKSGTARNMNTVAGWPSSRAARRQAVSDVGLSHRCGPVI